MVFDSLLEVGGKILDRVIPDPAQRDAAKLKLMELNQNGDLTELTARADIIKAEAQSESWLAANWRPLMMLTFGWLIVSRWYGWAAPNLTQDEYMKLWDIVYLGINGYIVGRSAEKVIPPVVDALKKK